VSEERVFGESKNTERIFTENLSKKMRRMKGGEKEKNPMSPQTGRRGNPSTKERPKKRLGSEKNRNSINDPSSRKGEKKLGSRRSKREENAPREAMGQARKMKWWLLEGKTAS